MVTRKSENEGVQKTATVAEAPDAATHDPARYLVVTPDDLSLSLHAKPLKTNVNSTGSVPCGHVVGVDEVSGEWAHVVSETVQGWGLLKYLGEYKETEE